MNTQAESKTILPVFTVQERCVLYARVSGDDRKYATSGIEGQLGDCRKYAQEKGYRVIGEFYEQRDKQTSGYDWLPELEKVIKLAGQKAFDVLIIREIDRLARNRFKQMSIENWLESFGLRVEYVIGQYEDTTEGRLLKGIMGEFAEYEREKIRERIVRGMIKTVESGNVFTGGSIAPYGYDIAKVDGKRLLVINEDEASIIRLIFNFYVNQNYTLAAIADYLNELSTPRPGKGKNHKDNIGRGRGQTANWSPANIHSVLSNEVYMGRWHYGKTRRTKDVTTGKIKMIPRPKEEWLTVEIQPIVGQDVFKAAQEQRQQNKKAKRTRKNGYLFGGMICCGHCGYSATGFTTQWASYYVCNPRRNPKQFGFKCEDGKFIRAEWLDNAVWDWLKSIILDPDTLQKHLEEYQAQQARPHPLAPLLETNRAKLADLETRKGRLIAAYSAGVFSLDDIAIQKVDLDRQIGELKRAIEALEDELKPNILTNGEIAYIHELAAKVRRGWDLASNKFEIKRKIVELLKVKIRLRHVDGVFYADVTCVLGEQSIVTGSHTEI
jgi:site-specific DNA recombinase